MGGVAMIEFLKVLIISGLTAIPIACLMWIFFWFIGVLEPPAPVKAFFSLFKETKQAIRVATAYDYQERSMAKMNSGTTDLPSAIAYRQGGSETVATALPTSLGESSVFNAPSRY